MQARCALAVRTGSSDMVCVRGVRPACKRGREMVAPRFTACSSVSIRSAPPPSPMTKPSRSRVKRAAGVREDRRCGAKAPWPATRPDTTIGQRMLSPPTASTASASPALSSMAAAMIASPPAEQAVLRVRLGTVDAARDGDLRGRNVADGHRNEARADAACPASKAAWVCATVVTRRPSRCP